MESEGSCVRVASSGCLTEVALYFQKRNREPEGHVPSEKQVLWVGSSCPLPSSV